ncbi:APC family permease [uncultured Parvibaculum sp.]|uniref:APC family permease n=1 Tax=uncultured Parvibaculum sp. TaxID=291828 RepID=UPI0030D712D6
MAKGSDDGIGFWSAAAIGIGGMVGGGIFAVLGLSVELAQGGAPVAFMLAGIVALVTSYAYVKLSVAMPEQGGTVSFLDNAFGSGLLTGSANILLWLSYVIMLSLYAYAFGSYGAQLFPPMWDGIARHGLISFVIIAMTGLNLMSVKSVGNAEELIVGVKIAILLVFVGFGMMSVDAARMAPSQWAPPISLIAGGMIIFVAYEGFELIANTAQDVRDPKRNLPRAFYFSVGFVILLYVAVAAVTIGNLAPAEVTAARDYALAAAAKPFLGQAGYGAITLAALLSTMSAINATLYGAARLSYVIATDGELPKFLGRKIWNRPVSGLLITCGVTLLTANFFNLQSISTMGSTGFLLIFAAVNAAAFHLSARIGAVKWLPGLGVALCLGALAALLWQTGEKHPEQLWVLALLVGLAFLIEIAYRVFGIRKNGKA